MTKKFERKGLGRGLSALLADVSVEADSGSRPTAADTQVPIEKIHANPDQPRRDFSESELGDLERSIREKGVIQPLIVRPDPSRSGEFQIVAGERRWRAAQRAQLHTLPVLVRDLDDTEVLELAIIENIQRADLNAIEEAAGYRQLMDKFGHTQERLAEALGKSRSHIANLLRLLNLPTEVQKYLREGKLSAGHARALITAEDPAGLAREVLAKGLSVRQTEILAKTKKAEPIQKRKLVPNKDADTRALETELTAHLRTKVAIDHRAGTEAGMVKISYTTLEELVGICQLLTQQS